MMKQFAFLWCLVAAASVGAADHVASVNLEVDDPAVEVEELVDVRVMVSTTAPVNVVELRLEYDATYLRPLAVDCDGGAFTFDGLIDLDSVPGVVLVIRGEPHGTAPKGDDLDVCAVQFLARLATAATEVRVRPPHAALPCRPRNIVAGQPGEVKRSGVVSAWRVRRCLRAPGADLRYNLT
jgi:hypothetical protein